MKLNLGSHNKRIKGYTNVDALGLENVDIVHNLTEYPYPFEENSIDEILMTEVLEHISWRKTDAVLKECFRILKVGGKMHIQVPDCGNMMKAMMNDWISEIIPHKPESEDQVLKLRKETGKTVHPNRWLMAFCGAQKHEFDAHLNIFTAERLEDYIINAGFNKWDFKEDKLGWKLKVDIWK